MKIQVFGPGCMNCQKLEQLAKTAVAELNLDAQIEKVSAINDIVAAGIMRTPGLGINGKVVSQGRVPKLEEIKKLLQDNA